MKRDAASGDAMEVVVITPEKYEEVSEEVIKKIIEANDKRRRK